MEPELSGVLVAHPGTQHAPRLAAELERLGRLGEFWTGFGLGEGARLSAYLPERLRARLLGRVFSGVPGSRLRRLAWAEFVALTAVRCGAGEERALFWRNGVFQRGVPDRALARAGAVVGFDTSSWVLAERCRRLGVPFVLEQTTPHSIASREIYATLERRFPDWPPEFEGKGDRLIEMENREHGGARVISVASQFSRRTLIEHGVDAAKVRVNPYGIDIGQFDGGGRRGPDGRLRFLYLGAVTARKGAPVLLEAWRQLGARDAELVIAGPIAAARRKLVESIPGVIRLDPVSKDRVPALMGEADVFVFPSLFDGFGLAQLEAMAAGLPVITTDASAGPDLIEDGAEGFVVAAGDAGALAERMRRYIAQRYLARQMGERARIAAGRFSWRAYGERLLGMIGELVKGEIR